MSAPPPDDDPPVSDYNDSTSLYVAAGFAVVLSSVFVALRFWSRKLKQLKLGLDDWLILVSLLLQHGYMAATLVAINVGGIRQDTQVLMSDGSTETFLQSVLAADVLSILSLALIRLSVIAFYRRIFPTEIVKWGGYIIGTANMAWAVAFLFVNFLSCQPLEASWHVEMQNLPGTTCINIKASIFSSALISCMLDLAIILLPVRDIVALQTTRKRKFSILGIFLFGGLSFTASLIRTVVTGTRLVAGDLSVNRTEQIISPGIIATAEIYLAIIGACLPTIIPVYHQIRYGNAFWSINKYSVTE